MLVNIHGFSGNGNNTKYRWLREHAGDQKIYSPTFDYGALDPERVLDRLAGRILSWAGTQAGDMNGIYVLGSSLGAFFARCLNLLYPTLTTILINPSLAPFLTLRGRIDCKAYLALCARLAYADDALGKASRLHVILGDADELIDHERLTKPLLPPDFKQIHVIRGGTHQLALDTEASGILLSILGHDPA